MCDNFQMVILQRVQLVTGAKHICVRIDSQLESWNNGVFDEIVCDYYKADTGYLGRVAGIKVLSSNILHYRTLLYIGNCTRPSD